MPDKVEGSSIKYDIYFQRWGQYYFPFEDWRWFKAQGIAESNLNPKAISRVGAIGIMQLMPMTAKELKVNPYNIEQNIQGGIKYDRQIDKKLSHIANPNRRNLMFASYNAGMGWIFKAMRQAESTEWPLVAEQLKTITGKNSAETIKYVSRINIIYRRLQ